LNDEASIGPSPNWLDYQHNNMLRASITGTWGFGLAENPTSGMIVTNEYSFGLEDGWDPDNISFVVFVTNNEDFAILQAAEQSLKGKSVKADGKVAMLEEFTGHVCVNCPEATMLAHDLKEKYGENLVLLAIHAGDLSLPEEAPYDADYRTTTGTTIFNEFQPIGVPTGLVNRVQYNGGYVLFKDSWEAAIQEQLNLPQDVSIEIIVEVAE
jgi:thiol-disulfide isomerase/thioredoxin